MSLLRNLFDRSGSERATAPALDLGPPGGPVRTFRWAEIDARSVRMAHVLSERGLAAWRITEADRYLAVLPLFHVHGLGNGVCSWLASGCRMRLVERFEHEKAAALFEEFRPTLFFGVPTIYGRLLDLPEDAARRIGERMRLFVSGSAPLSAHVFEAFRTRFGHAILERYGMTETLMTLGNPYEACRRHLASFKVPRRFVRVGSLARNALGKVQKHLLVADDEAGDR